MKAQTMNRIGGRDYPAIPRWLIWCGVISGMIAGWILIDIPIDARSREKIAADVDEVSSQMATALEAEIYASTTVSSGLASVLELSPELLERNYEKVVGGLLRSHKNIVNVVLAPDLVISQVYPLKGNERSIGLDLTTLGDNMGAAGLRQAIEEKRTVLVGPINRKSNGASVFVARAPIFASDALSSDEPWGIAAILIDAPGLFETVGLTQLSETHAVGIRAVSDDGLSGNIVYGSADVFDMSPVIRTIRLPGISWQIAILPKGGWDTAANGEQTTEFLMYLLFCGLILGLVWKILQNNDLRKKAESMLSDALDAIDDGFVIFDQNDRFLACNQAYRDLYKESADLFVPGTPFSEIVYEGARRGQYAEAVGREDEWAKERLEQHRACSSEVVQRLKDGRWLKISERRTAGGAIVGFRVDITELKEARESAEHAYRAKSEFISVLSHELRTPLTIILGYAKVLANLHRFKDVQELESILNEDVIDGDKVAQVVSGLVKKTTDQAVKMEKSGAHLLVLINDLLDYSKIEAGHFVLSREETSLKALVNSVVEDMSEFAFSRGIELKDETRDVIVDADHIRLKQVLINLINNAIKFTEAGEVRVETALYEDCIEVSVVDTGCGIAPDKLGTIFDAFQQADLSDRRSANGTGLGLAISRRIMELHGGTLQVESTPGQGSRFYATLPREEIKPNRKRTVTARLLSENAA